MLSSSMAQSKQELLDKRHGLNKLIAYIINNWEGFVYYEQMHKRRYVIASSLVEKAADVVIAKRQKKQQGMHWGHEGGDGITALRTLWLNDDWETYWQERRTQKTAWTKHAQLLTQLQTKEDRSSKPQSLDEMQRPHPHMRTTLL